MTSPALRTIDELVANDEDSAVEFKSTARWDLRENTASRLMEDAVVKTVAGFLNSDGGTLLIGLDQTASRSAWTRTTDESDHPTGTALSTG